MRLRKPSLPHTCSRWLPHNQFGVVLQDARKAAEQLRQARVFVQRAERAAPALDAWPFVAALVAGSLAGLPGMRGAGAGAAAGAAGPGAAAGESLSASAGPSGGPSWTLAGALCPNNAGELQRQALAQLYTHVSPANAAKLAAAVRGLPAAEDAGAAAAALGNGPVVGAAPFAPSFAEKQASSASANAGTAGPGAAQGLQSRVMTAGGAPALGASAAWLALAVRAVADAAGDGGDAEHEYDTHARPSLSRLAPEHLAALAAWLVLAGPPPLPGAPVLAPGALPPGLRARAARDATAAAEQALAPAHAGTPSMNPSSKPLKTALGSSTADGAAAGRQGAVAVENGGDGGVEEQGGALTLRALLEELRREAGRLGVLGEVRARVALAPAELAAVEAMLMADPGHRVCPARPHDDRSGGAAAAGGPPNEPGRDPNPGDPNPGPMPDLLAACIRGLALGGCNVHKLLAISNAVLGSAPDGLPGGGGGTSDAAAAHALVASAVADVVAAALVKLGGGGAVAATATAASGAALQGVAHCLAGPCLLNGAHGPLKECPSPTGGPLGVRDVDRSARFGREGLHGNGGEAAAGGGSPAAATAMAVAVMRNAMCAELVAYADARRGGAGAQDAPALQLLAEIWPDAGAGRAARCSIAC